MPKTSKFRATKPTTWNHRVVCEPVKSVLVREDEKSFWSIREAYYDANGRPHLWSIGPRAAIEDDLDGLKQTLNRMSLACTHPVLYLRRARNGKERLTETAQMTTQDKK